MSFLSMLQSGNENSEHDLNPVPYTIYTYLSGSAFLVILTAPNKQSFRKKSVFKSRDHLSNSKTINKFIALFEVKVALFSYFKQLP